MITIVIDGFGELQVPAEFETWSVEEQDAYIDKATEEQSSVKDKVVGGSKKAAEAVVSKAKDVVANVDQALDKVIRDGKLTDLGGAVNPKSAAIGYVSAVVTTQGIDGASRYLNIPTEVLNNISVFVKYLSEAGKIVSETPSIIPIAAVAWAVKHFARGAVNLPKPKVSFRSLPAGWGHVGLLLGQWTGNMSIGRAITKGGPYAMIAITAALYRSEIYGAIKAGYDLFVKDVGDKEKAALDEDLHQAGDPNNPRPLDINPETGEVTFKALGGFIGKPKSLIANANVKAKTMMDVSNAPIGNSPMNNLIGSPNNKQLVNSLIPR